MSRDATSAPTTALGWQALRVAQAEVVSRDATKAAAEAMRAQALAVFDLAATWRTRGQRDPDAVPVADALAALGDATMAGADAVESATRAQALAAGFWVMVSAREG